MSLMQRQASLQIPGLSVSSEATSFAFARSLTSEADREIKLLRAMKDLARYPKHVMNAGRSNMRHPVTWFAVVYVAIVMGFIIIISNHAGPPSDEKRQLDPVFQRGSELEQEIETTYENLKSREMLTYDNDVTTMVSKYIPVGMPFDEAKRILRAAGCEVSPEPNVQILRSMINCVLGE